MRETGWSGFKKRFMDELKVRFPGCVIFHMDPISTHQGIPDLMILLGNRWAMLEVKAAPNSAVQPNQEYWVDYYNDMSYAAFVFPENAEEILNDLEHALTARRPARVSKR